VIILTLEEYREEIKLKLTGYILEIELDDDTIDKIIYSALREMQRYFSATNLITIPFSKCIDLSNLTDPFGSEVKISSVSRVYRA
jgi:hypothetical protein